MRKGFNKVMVEFYSYTRTPDAKGLGTTKQMTKIAEEYGYFDWVSGNDKYTNDQYRKTATHVFIALNKQIIVDGSENYLKFNGNFYKILLVDYPVQSNQTEMLLKLEENVE